MILGIGTDIIGIDINTGAAAPTFVLAAGGTGGHLFPAQALAEELAGRGAVVHVARAAGDAERRPLHEGDRAGRLGQRHALALEGPLVGHRW